MPDHNYKKPFSFSGKSFLENYDKFIYFAFSFEKFTMPTKSAVIQCHEKFFIQRLISRHPRVQEFIFFYL